MRGVIPGWLAGWLALPGPGQHLACTWRHIHLQQSLDDWAEAAPRTGTWNTILYAAGFME
jgi:hypothetical protein